MTRRAVLGFSLFGLVVFALALLTRLPASIVTNFLHESTASTTASALRLTMPQGTLWRGSAQVSVMQTDFGRLAWQVSPTSLVTLSPQLDWALQDSGLSGKVKSEGDTLNADLSGSLDLAQLAPILSRYAIAAEGRISFKDLRIAQSGNMIRLSGQVDWTGGNVDLGIGDWQARQALPALRAEAAEAAEAIDASRLRVTLLDEATNTRLPAGEIELMEDGWVKLGVTGHLAKYFNESFSDARDPSEIVLSVEERLL